MEKLIIIFGVSVAIALIFGLIILGPILSILAVNHLFGTSIAFTFWNWLAAFWLHMVAVTTVKTSTN
jgi:hypothetical protein